jgi:membrane-bound serine protease (ClpP class)
VERLERSRSERLVAFLDMIAPLLLVAGLLLAFTELKAPGFGLPGILAVACFALLLVGRWLAGLADVPHLVAVVVGLALIAVELFVLPGMLWPGIVGALLVVAGLILASVGPGIGFDGPLERTLLVDATFELFATALVAVLGGWVLSRFLPRAPILKHLVLDPERDGDASAMRGVPVFAEAPDARPELARVGAEGVATTDLRPVGKIVLDLDRTLEHEASAAGLSIDRGARVRVIEVREGRLLVESAGPEP